MLTAHWVRARGGARWKVMVAGLLASALLVATAHARTSTVESTLAALTALPQWHLDHVPTEERMAFLLPIAKVIAEESNSRDERAALIAHAWSETKFAQLVLTGRCQEMPVGSRCDGGRARGPWQVHRWCQAAWSAPDGSIESYRGAARCLLSVLRMGQKRCGNWKGAFAGLRGAPVCVWDRAAQYESVRQRVLQKM